VVRRIFALAADGLGHALIVKRLTEGKVPAFGSREKDENGQWKAARGRPFGSGHWTRAYVALLLKDRRVLGGFQPRRTDWRKDGPPIANYFPPVISEDEWYAASAASASRLKKHARGRIGNDVNIFAGLLRNARPRIEEDPITGESKVVSGDGYYAATRTDG